MIDWYEHPELFMVIHHTAWVFTPKATPPCQGMSPNSSMKSRRHANEATQHGPFAQKELYVLADSCKHHTLVIAARWSNSENLSIKTHHKATMQSTYSRTPLPYMLNGDADAHIPWLPRARNLCHLCSSFARNKTGWK